MGRRLTLILGFLLLAVFVVLIPAASFAMSDLGEKFFYNIGNGEEQFLSTIVGQRYYEIILPTATAVNTNIRCDLWIKEGATSFPFNGGYAEWKGDFAEYSQMVRYVESGGAVIEETYTFRFRFASHLAALTSLEYQLAGTSFNISGFSTACYLYEVILPATTAADARISLSGRAAEKGTVQGGSVVLSDGQGQAELLVIAEDGQTRQSYTVIFVVAGADTVDDEAKLSYLAYRISGGETVALSLKDGLYNYQVSLPAGTAPNAAITVQAIAGGDGLIIDNTGAILSSGNGQAQVLVRSAGGKIATYTIDFTVTAEVDDGGNKPPIPQLVSVGSYSVSILAVSGYQYSIDGGLTWQTDGVFGGLMADTEYSIISRKLGGNKVSDALTVRTSAATGSSLNRLTGIHEGQQFKVGDTITFLAIGIGLDNNAPQKGDIRYLPYRWSGAGSGFWDQPPYRASLDFLLPGFYTLTVIFEKQSYDGSQWVYARQTEQVMLTFLIVAMGGIVDPGDDADDSDDRSKEVVVRPPASDGPSIGHDPPAGQPPAAAGSWLDRLAIAAGILAAIVGLILLIAKKGRQIKALVQVLISRTMKRIRSGTKANSRIEK